MIKKLFVVVALIVTLIPALFVLEKVGGIENWRGVPPTGVTDSLYYYARIHEVADGHPFIGHPYIFEYRGEHPPSFFLPDLITAMPLLVGLPFSIAILVNVFLSSFLFLFLAYKLLILLRVGERWAIGCSLLLYISSYAFMLRPTVMQAIFPLVFFFLLTFIGFLYEPHAKRRALSLAFASALTFYFYNYLAFTVFLTLAFVFLWYLMSKQFKELRALSIVGIYTSVLLIPFGIYSLIQMQGSLYAETLMRIGLTDTRIPTMEAFLFGRWIIIGLCACALLWFFFPKKEKEDSARKIFWVSTGCALFVGLFLNVITGVEAFFAIHIGRFVILWMVLLLGVVVYEWYFSHTKKSKGVALFAHAAIGFLVLLLLIGTIKNIPRALAFFEFDTRGYAVSELQAYGAPLAWLENNLSEQSVIWSNLSLGSYIPILTKHYTLFHDNAVLHNIPGEELEERYLLSKSLDEVTIDSIKHDFGLYAGAGPSQEQPLAQNNRARFCTLLSRFVDRGVCPQKTDAITLQGEAYFEGLFEQFESVKVNRADLLNKYHVSYLVIDTRYDTFEVPASESAAVYADGRFFIFPVAVVSQKMGK